MPPTAAKNFSIIFFDLKVNDRENALNVLSNILLYRQLSISKDDCKLFAVNCSEDIFNIDAQANIGEIINTISELKLGTSNLMDILNFGVQQLKPLFGKTGFITLQLVLLSDLQFFERSKDGNIEDSIIKDLNSCEIFLYIIGPDFEPQQTLFSENCLRLWMQDVVIPENYEVKSIIANTSHSVICNFDLGLHIFNSFKYRKGKQPWLEPLSFGSLLTLPFPVIKLTECKRPFQLKLDKTETQIKWVYEDQEDIEVNICDTISGLVLHDRFVKIDSEGKFKVNGPRCFSALGFTDAINIPEYLFQNESYLIASNGQQDKNYLEFLYVLIHSMIKLNKYIVAKKVYYANVTPKYVVLIPRLDNDFKGFLLCELPYAEDIAYLYYENVNDPHTATISDDVNTFLETLNLNSSTSKLKVPLAPKLMVDTSSMNIVQRVLEITLDEKLICKKYDILIPHKTDIEALKNAWPIREIQEVKKEELDDDDDFENLSDFNFLSH